MFRSWAVEGRSVGSSPPSAPRPPRADTLFRYLCFPLRASIMEDDVEAAGNATEEVLAPPPPGPQVATPSTKSKAKSRHCRKGFLQGVMLDEDGQGEEGEEATVEDDGKKDDKKRCDQCKKNKLCADFYARQSICKSCHLASKTILRLAKAEGKSEWLDAQKRDNPKEYLKLMRHYSALEATVGAKKKFSLATFIEKTVATSGLRSVAQGEMMWEGQYHEWAKTAAAGFLTRSEADCNWQKWTDDPLVLRDELGPRGCLRCYVKTADLVQDRFARGLQRVMFVAQSRRCCQCWSEHSESELLQSRRR